MKRRDSGVFHVRQNEGSLTLAAGLRVWLKDLSWSEIRGLIQKRFILIDGNVCTDPQRRLKPGVVVKRLSDSALPAPGLEDVRIVYFDRHVVVVDKPPGLNSVRHASEKDWPRKRKQLQPTLEEHVNRLLSQLDRSAAKGKRAVPVRPVHRIDRETSGLLVFARSREAEVSLTQQFRKHTTHRRYWALAFGRVEAARIETKLVRDRGDGLRGSSDNPKLGKAAITHVRPLASFGENTLVECRLETGRTHQIRIHLSERGNPLCGDKTYRGKREGKPLQEKSGAKRLALHAVELGFTHPVTGEACVFQSSLPDDFVALLARVGGQAVEQVRALERQNRSRLDTQVVVKSSAAADVVGQDPPRKGIPMPRDGENRNQGGIVSARSEAPRNGTQRKSPQGHSSAGRKGRKKSARPGKPSGFPRGRRADQSDRSSGPGKRGRSS